MQVFYFVSSHNIQPSSLSGGIVEGSGKELKLFAIALGHWYCRGATAIALLLYLDDFGVYRSSM